MGSNSMLSLSLYEKNIRFFFVTTDDGILSTDMDDAYEKLCECVAKENINTISEEECLAVIAESNKDNVFIFKSFKGDVFEQARKKCKSPIIGPRCLHSCLADNIVVPHVVSPIYTMAMRDLVVCASKIEPAEKRQLEKLIGYMGGMYTNSFMDKVTHLVTEDIFTNKYEMATTRGVKVMKPSWVTDVWASSCRDNVLATNTEKFGRHVLSPFYNKRFTSTGLALAVKNEVKKLVETNGGTYSGSYSSRYIDILIMEADSMGSDKHKAAEKNKIECLTPEWVLQSAKKGFAVPIDKYKIVSPQNIETSTPEKADKSNEQFEMSNASVLSRIGGGDSDMSINETLMSNTGSPMKIGTNRGGAAIVPYKDAFNKLDVRTAKKAGLFLDGCNVFVCGFTADEKDKIFKILNNSGATRYETIHTNITHIIVGVPNKMELNLISATQTGAPMMTLDWLLECIQQKQMCTDIERFTYRMKVSKGAELEPQDAPSPASKKNILSMTSANDSMKAPRKRLAFDESENNPNAPNRAHVKPDDMEEQMLDQYLSVDAHAHIALTSPPKETTLKAGESSKGAANDNKGSMRPPPVPPATTAKAVTPTTSVASTSADSDSKVFTSQMSSSEMSQNLDFLMNMTVCIMGFDTESHEHLAHYCERAGADVVENTVRDVDYLITSVDKMTMNDVCVKATHVVNSNWLMQSKKVNSILDVVYYFEPVIFPEELKPLEGLVIVFSIYAGDERVFLTSLAECLGADIQAAYKRAARPLLICPNATPDNPKYLAAVKWNLSVVSSEWLMQCYAAQRRLPMGPFLLGDSVAPPDDVVDLDATPVNHASDLGAPVTASDSDTGTPALRHRRVAALQDVCIKSAEKRSSPDELIEEPWMPVEEASALFNWDTPTRDHYVKTVAQHEEMSRNETPQTKRRRLEEYSKIGTPEMRELISSPYQEKLRQDALEAERLAAEERRRPATPQQVKKSTPWSEFKRRFWKNALGDQYCSPSMCETANTQALQTSYVDGSQVADTPARNVEDDTKMKKLNALISRRNIINDLNVVETEPIPESMPVYSAETDFPNTNEEVGWRDPTELPQTPRTPRRVAPVTSQNAMKFVGTPRFALSGDNDELIIAKIHSLKGIVCTDIEKIERNYTHFIAETPNRGQNTFACVVAGKWLLSPQYIIDSADAGYFMDEELYEWGNPKARLDKTNNDMANAAYRWRVKLQTDPAQLPTHGAFKDFRVILPKNNKQEQLRCLIMAGGGIVVDAKEPYCRSPELSQTTHFVSNRMTLSAEDVKAFMKHKIICVSMMYLNAYVTSDEPPDVNKYLLK